LVIFYLLFALIVVDVYSAEALAAQPDVAVLADRLEDEWSEIFYHAPENQKVRRLRDLLRRAEALTASYPNRAEPLVVEGIVLCTLAGVDWGLSSLDNLNRSRLRLVQAIDIDPKAMDGAAYVTLGNLYWRLPGWPISYGDDNLARRYLQSALVLFPDALDTNYFMGDFLIDTEEYGAALEYLERAERAPIRPYQRVSDLKIKTQVAEALKVARAKGGSRSNFFSELVPDFKRP